MPMTFTESLILIVVVAVVLPAAMVIGFGIGLWIIDLLPRR